MKASRKTDLPMYSRQRQTRTRLKSPQFTSNFAVDNKLFYLFLDMYNQDKREK